MQREWKMSFVKRKRTNAVTLSSPGRRTDEHSDKVLSPLRAKIPNQIKSTHCTHHHHPTTTLQLIHEHCLLQTIQPRLCFLHIDSDRPHGTAQLHQSRFGSGWFGNVATLRQGDRNDLAVAFGLLCGQTSRVLNGIFRRLLGANDHVTSWASTGVHPPVRSVAMLRIQGQFIVISGLLSYSDFHLVSGKVTTVWFSCFVLFSWSLLFSWPPWWWRRWGVIDLQL